MLGIMELQNLEYSVRHELEENLLSILTKANRMGYLENLLSMLGMESLLGLSGNPISGKGKIVVIGGSDVKANTLAGVAEVLGIDKHRLEFYLDYEACQKFNYRRLQFNSDYSLILVGPMPHSTACKGDYSSIIHALESESGYPNVVRLGSNGLKITKSNFKSILSELIQSHRVCIG